MGVEVGMSPSLWPNNGDSLEVGCFSLEDWKHVSDRKPMTSEV